MWSTVALVLFVACGGSDPTTSAADVAAEPVAAPVRLLVDGVEVGTWTPGEEVELATLLPEAHRDAATWRGIRGTSGPRTWSVSTPATTYGPGTVRLYLHEGRPSVAVFRVVGPDASPAQRSLSAVPASRFIGVEGVEVVIAEPAPPVEVAPTDGSPADGSLRILAPGGAEHALTEEILASFPAPEGPRGRTRGAPLRASIVAVIGDGPFEAVRLTTDQPAPVVIDAATLDDSWTIKRNQRGEWVVRRTVEGGSEEYRPVRSITVERRAE